MTAITLRLLSADSATSVTLTIRDLTSAAIAAAADRRLTPEEANNIFHKSIAALVAVVENARASNGDPLAGVDKKAIVAEALRQVLQTIKPLIVDSVLMFISAQLPWPLRVVAWVASKLWDASLVDRLESKIPEAIDVVVSGLNMLWKRQIKEG